MSDDTRLTEQSLHRAFHRGYDDRMAHRREVPHYNSPVLQERYEDGVRAVELKMGFVAVDAKKSHA